jgi:hypothetical protein
LPATVGMVNQPVEALTASSPDGHLEGVDGEVRTQRGETCQPTM